MTDQLPFLAVSLVGLVAFLFYWVRRIEAGHARRIARVAEDEASTRVRIDMALGRVEHYAAAVNRVDIAQEPAGLPEAREKLRTLEAEMLK
jgi:hypothetical protein